MPRSADFTPFGQLVERYRVRRGLNRDQLAAAVGIGRTTVWRQLTGKSEPNDREREAYRATLHIPQREFEAAVAAALRAMGLEATAAPPTTREPDARYTTAEGESFNLEAKTVRDSQRLSLPRRLDLLALDFEREMVEAEIDEDFRRYARARLRDPELLEMYVGGHSEKPMTAEEQLADYEDLLDELRGRLKRRLALVKKRRPAE